MSWDPYEYLGVPPDASSARIKRAYRLLMRKYHPDVASDDGDAAHRFARARAAFELLGDPVRRARFDRGEIDADGNPKDFSFQDMSSGRRGRGQSHEFESIFEGVFGDARSPKSATGDDWRHGIDIDFLQSVTGCSRRLKLSGGIPFDVSIPAGIKNGQVLRIRGKGHRARGMGPPGNALITVRIKAHPTFSADGRNIRMEARISLTEAVEGGRITLDGPTGQLSVSVPQGAGSGDTLRLKGKGMQTSPAGDLLVRLMVVIPEKGREELRSFLTDWSGRSATPRR